MMMRSLAGLALCVSLLSLSAIATAQVDFQVPMGSEPVLDGTLSDGEWDDAATIELGLDAMLFMKCVDELLFLGIRGTTMGIPSPLILRNEDVQVLHASAALGTGIYSLQEDTWTQTQAFDWQCRSRGFSSSAVAAREAFFESERWLGTIGFLGSRTHFEYKIEVEGATLLMLFLYMEATDPLSILSWPATPQGVEPYLPLITGPIPEQIEIDFGMWANLSLDLDEATAP